MLVLIEISPLDTATGNRVTLRAASDDNRAITGLNGVRWWPAIKATPTLDMKLFDGDFSSPPDTGGASFTLLTDKLARLDANARRYRWAGAPVNIYAGTSGTAWPWTQWFAGRVDTFQQESNQIKVTAKVDLEPFQKNALTLTYAGTGGAEGGADVQNKVKPWLMGRCFNAEPVLIDATNSVFQFSAYGPIQGVTTLYERASDFGASVGDYASYAALVAATIPSGRWGTCLAQGMVRLGAPPYGVITGDVDGDKPSGTWNRATGAIISRIATNAGAGALLDTASLTALDTAVAAACTTNNGYIGVYLTDQTTVLDIAQRLARGCNAQAAVSWLGKLFVTRVTIAGSAALTLDAQGRRKPGVTGSVESDVSPPYFRLEMGAARSWRVHTLQEIATSDTLLNRGAYDATAWYKGGNIVTDQSSTWLYVNATPGSGHAPPTLPTTSNAYWQIMAGAGATGATGATGAQGNPGPAIVLTPTAAAFRTTDNAYNPSSQTITTTATLQNVSGTISWTTSPNIKTGTGTTFALTQADMGANLSVVVTATCSGTTQSLTIPVIDDSTAASGAGRNIVPVYSRSAAQPSTPTGNGTPSGWYGKPSFSWSAVTSAGVTGSVSSTTFTKTGGVSGSWDSSVRSVEGITGDVSVTFKPSQTNKNIMIGLNSDPATDDNYTSLDFAVWVTDSANLYVNVNGTLTAQGLSYVAGDTITVSRNGNTMTAYKNGVALTTTATITATVPLYLDSSFDGAGGAVNSVTFAPGALSGTGPVWVSYGEQNADATLVGSWSTPVRYTDAEAFADVTRAVSWALAGGVVTLNADSGGTILSGQLPMTLALPVVTKGGTSIRTDDITTYAIANSSFTAGYVTVDNTTGSSTKGQVTLTSSIAGAGGFNLVISYNGQQIASYHVDVKVQNASSGGGGGVGATSASFTVNDYLIATSYAQIGSTVTVTVAGGATIRTAFSDSYDTAGLNKNATPTVKWQYSPTGAGTWSDFAAGVSGYAAITDSEGTESPGSITCNKTVTPASGTYDVRLVAQKSGTGPVIFDTTTATVSVS